MTPEDYEKQVLEKLSFLIPPRKRSKREHFAIGLLLVAPFCLILGILPSLSTEIFYKVLWIVFGFILLMVGAWQWDKSHKDMDCDDEGSVPTIANRTMTSGSGIRRIK